MYLTVWERSFSINNIYMEIINFMYMEITINNIYMEKALFH